MTVIAAVLTTTGGAIVAADSQTTKTTGTHFPAAKLIRTRWGIAGAAGDGEACALFLDWMAHGGMLIERPRFKSSWSWEGILVTREQILDFGGAPATSDPVKLPFHAIGAGADGALAVMAYQVRELHPLDPKAAVLAVCDTRDDCGPPVDYLTLRPPKEKKR